jgi:hypothetical protein
MGEREGTRRNGGDVGGSAGEVNRTKSPIFWGKVWDRGHCWSWSKEVIPQKNHRRRFLKQIRYLNNKNNMKRENYVDLVLPRMGAESPANATAPQGHPSPTGVHKRYDACSIWTFPKQKRKEQERVREGIDLDHSDGDEEDSDDGNEVIVLQPTRVSQSNTSRAVAGDVTVEKFYKACTIEESVQRGSNVSQKVQTKLTTQKREERRDRACEYICQFFYEASIC